MNPKTQLVFCDGGGTLWNSLPKLYDSYQHAYRWTVSQARSELRLPWLPDNLPYGAEVCHRLRGLPGCTKAGQFTCELIEQLKTLSEAEAEERISERVRLIGSGKTPVVSSISQNMPLVTWCVMFEAIITHYERELDPPFYPLCEGATSLARELAKQGVDFALVSNRDAKSTRVILRDSMAVWTDEKHFLNLGTKAKEDVSAVKDVDHWLEDRRIPKGDTLWLGDSVTDMMAAKNCGVRAVGVLGGMSSETDLRHTGAVEVLGCLADVWCYLKSL